MRVLCTYPVHVMLALRIVLTRVHTAYRLRTPYDDHLVVTYCCLIVLCITTSFIVPHTRSCYTGTIICADGNARSFMLFLN